MMATPDSARVFRPVATLLPSTRTTSGKGKARLTVRDLPLGMQEIVADLTATDGTDVASTTVSVTVNGKLVLISTLGGSDLAVLDAATRREVQRVKLGGGTAGIQMDPDGSRAFVASTQTGYVAVIDLKNLTISGRIDAGKEPDGLAWAVRE